MKKRLKINGLIIFIATALISAFPLVFFRRDYTYSFDGVVEIFGIAFILLGQILRASARGYKSQHSQNGSSLIQGGPYGLVRNPMYLGILLIGFGVVLVLFNWWVSIIFLFLFVTRYLLLIFKEEKKLLRMFPQAYLDYQHKVPRLIPSLSMLFDKDVCEYLPLKLGWLKKEVGSILAVLLLTLFIESWEEIRTEGIKAYWSEAALIMITVILFICLAIYLSKRTSSPNIDVSNKD